MWKIIQKLEELLNKNEVLEVIGIIFILVLFIVWFCIISELLG